MKSELVKGDSLQELKKYDDNSVDLLCTDPPYGYGFMGRDWDKVLPDIGIFEECFRVLKPGSMAFVMSAPRSDVQYRMAEMLEKVGFRIDYTPIYWTYASGFPKAMNMGKMLDKVGRDKKELDGSYAGFQPKPAVEVVIVAMKPLDKKGYLEQAEDNGKGVTWFDDCRIPFQGEHDYPGWWESGAKGSKGYLGTDTFKIRDMSSEEIKNRQFKTTNRKPRTEGSVFKESGFKSENNDTAEASPMGRFPANLLVSDDVLDDGKKRKAVPKGGFGAMDIGIGKPGETQKYRKKKMTMPDLRDVGKKSKEAIGIDKLSYGQVENAERKDYEMWDIQEKSIGYSRFFSLDEWFSKNLKQLPEPVQQTFPFLIVPKASKSEKNDGLDNFETKQAKGGGGTSNDTWYEDDVNAASGKFGSEKAPSRNIHPTVKPLTLMNYLVTLGSRKGDMVLDPFMGSGTTPLACISLERKYIGIDNEEEYYEIAKARVDKLEAPIKAWKKFI